MLSLSNLAFSASLDSVALLVTTVLRIRTWLASRRQQRTDHLLAALPQQLQHVQHAGDDGIAMPDDAVAIKQEIVVAARGTASATGRI
jgi:hypothetical protein